MRHRFAGGFVVVLGIWAWLAFRMKNDGSLRLAGNPGADAIKQRLVLDPKLIQKYFAFEKLSACVHGQ